MAQKDDELKGLELGAEPNLRPLWGAVSNAAQTLRPPEDWLPNAAKKMWGNAEAGVDAFYNLRPSPNWMNNAIKAAADAINEVVGVDAPGNVPNRAAVAPAVQKLIANVTGKVTGQAQAAAPRAATAANVTPAINTAPAKQPDVPSMLVSPAASIWGNTITSGGKTYDVGPSVPETGVEANPYDGQMESLLLKMQNNALEASLGSTTPDRLAQLGQERKALDDMMKTVQPMTSFGAYGIEGRRAENVNAQHAALAEHYRNMDEAEKEKLGLEQQKLDHILKSPKSMANVISLITNEGVDAEGNKIKTQDWTKLGRATTIVDAFERGDLDAIEKMTGSGAKTAVNMTRDEAFKRAKAKQPNLADAQIYKLLDDNYTFAGGSK